MKYFIPFSKAVLLAFYVLVPVTFATAILSDYRFILLAILCVILFTHMAEYLFLKNKISAAAPGQDNHLIRTLIFGYVHWLPLLDKKA